MSRDLFFFQAEDGIRDLVRSRGLGDVYKRQVGMHVDIALRDPGLALVMTVEVAEGTEDEHFGVGGGAHRVAGMPVLGRVEHMAETCLLYTSDAADERSSVDLGGCRIIKKKKTQDHRGCRTIKI